MGEAAARQRRDAGLTAMTGRDSPKCRADLIELAKTLRRRLDTLYTLGNVNDPWDVPYRSEKAYWVADIFERFEIRSAIHARQVHYRLISQETPIPQADGTPYVNSIDCYNTLCDAIRDARYLDLISTEVIIDRRNPEPTINFESEEDVGAEIEINDGTVERHDFGQFYAPPDVNLPGVSLTQEPAIGQRYLLEIWIEKSTANEVLNPLGIGHGINVATFIGEVSATACINLVNRAIKSGRPVRILHVTDFDPAGRDMPISAAVKIDFFAKKSGVDLDIRLEHVALTPEQCVQYQLPRTPIKKTEGRAADFEAKYGEGATELDALEALHPGALREILVEHIERYYHHDLDQEIDDAVEQYRDQLESAEAEIEEQFSEQISDINDQRERIAAAFEQVNGRAEAAYRRAVVEAQRIYDEALERVRDEIDEMEDRLVTQAETLLARMKVALEEAVPDPDLFDWPEPAEAEDGDALYDSTRGYVEQVDRYRDHTGAMTMMSAWPMDRVVTKTCKLCGESFSAANPKRIFCTSRCTNKSYKNSLRARA
jgi:hypothetical protein